MAIDTINPTTNRETAALEAAAPPRRDAYTVLDHRSRQRVTPRNQALPGHYLILEDVTGGEHLLQLDRSVTHIGRSAGADVVLDDARVSRRHAILVLDGGRARVLDDRSSHGTFVNGARIVSHNLEDGDVIRIGPVAVTYLVVR
jgi:hypothetical protein